MKTPLELSRAPLQSAQEQVSRSRSIGRTGSSLREVIASEDWTEQEVEVLLRATALMEGLSANYKKSSVLKTKDEAVRAARAQSILIELQSAPFLSQPDLSVRLSLIRHVNPALLDGLWMTDARSARRLSEEIYLEALRELSSRLARESGLPPAAAVAGFKEHFLANRAVLDLATHNLLARAQALLANDPLAN